LASLKNLSALQLRRQRIHERKSKTLQARKPH